MSVARSFRAALGRTLFTASLTAALASACTGELVELNGPSSKGDQAAADDPSAPSTQSTIGHFVRAQDPIPGEYIVVMRDDVTFASGGDVQALSATLATNYNAAVRQTFKGAIRGFSGAMAEKDAVAMSNDPRVAFVEENGRVYASATEAAQATGIDRIDQENLPIDGKYTFNVDGSGVTAYIIDTGIRATHQEFGGRGKFLLNFTGDGIDTDCNGHGTHVSGTIGGKNFGVAKNVKLVGIKVLGCDGSGSNAGVIQGINAATEDFKKNVKPAGGRAVANMSLGGGASSAVDTAVQNAIDAGIVFAVAAGNENADACGGSPSRAPNAITVAALDDARKAVDQRASFSNFGTCVDIFAPGVNIKSAFNGSDTATNTISGTSMATPHVAGVAALILSANPTFTPAQVRDFMVGKGLNGKNVKDRKGSPDVMLFTGAIAGGNPTPPPPAPPPAPTPPPAAGTPNSGKSPPLTVNAGQQINFAPLPAGNKVLQPDSTVTVTLAGDGDADLYVRFGAQPTLTKFDCRPFLNTSNEQCSIKVPAGQTKVFISVRGDVAPNGATTANFVVQANWVEK